MVLHVARKPVRYKTLALTLTQKVAVAFSQHFLNIDDTNSVSLGMCVNCGQFKCEALYHVKEN